MSEDDFNELQRRKFALEQAALIAVESETPENIVARAEAFDAFLRDKPAKAD